MSTDVQVTQRNDGYALATWASLGAGETGIAALAGQWAGLKSLQISGTFGSGTVTIQGSMDGATWFTLHALDYTAGDYVDLTGLSAALLLAIVENALFIRPVVAGGAGTDLAVIIGATTRL